MYNKSQLQGLNQQASHRSYKDIKQRQNGIQQLISNSNNSSFIQPQSGVHTRNNSSSTQNLSSNNINHSLLQNSIHQISQKQQPSLNQKRDNSLQQYPPKQEYQLTNQQMSRNDHHHQPQQQQIMINSIQDRNSLMQIIKKNFSQESINSLGKYPPESNRIPHQEKQASHQRINSECDSDFNKENASFCANSIQSNQQRSYNYETSFNSKVIHPEKNYFMPLKVQRTNRRNTNMSTDISNQNNSQRIHTNSQNNSGTHNTNHINSNNSLQVLKKTNGSSRLLTNLLNDSSANDNIIENYIEKVFSKDFQTHSTAQEGFESNQRQQKEDDLSFTQLNVYSGNTLPQQSLNQSNFNSESSSSAQEHRIQSQIQIQKKIQSQSIYEQALQQKLKLLPGANKENKNSSSHTQIPKPLKNSQELSGNNSSQMSQRNLSKYLFGEHSNSNKRHASQFASHSITDITHTHEDSPERGNNHIIQPYPNKGSKDNLIKPFTILQKEREECGVPASMYESEINKEKISFNNSNLHNQINNNSNVSNQSKQPTYNSNTLELENKIQDLEQKSMQLEHTLLQKVKQIEQMGNQMHEYEKEKKEMISIIEELRMKSNNENKQLQEAQFTNQSLQLNMTKQQAKIKEQNDQLQLLNMQIFETEQQLYEINANFKEKERLTAKERSDQILQLKQKFESEVMQLNEQHSQLIQLQNISAQQTEFLQNEKLELLQKLENIDQLNKKLECEVVELKQECTDLRQQQQLKQQQSPNIKNEQIAFLEQQLQESEKEIRDTKKKFSTIIINVSMVLELIQKKIQNYSASLKMSDKSTNFSNLSEQLMGQVIFGINQMSMCIQPIIEEMKFLSQDSSQQSTFRQSSKRSQSVGGDIKADLNPSSSSQNPQYVRRNYQQQNEKPVNNEIQVNNQVKVEQYQQQQQMDLKNVQTASFGDQIQIVRQNPSESQQEERNKISTSQANHIVKTGNQCSSDLPLQLQNNQHQNLSNVIVKDYNIPKSDTALEIQSIKNRIQQRQQKRRQNDSNYNSNNSFSYNSNQSGQNNYFTVGREFNSYSLQNHSFSCDNQNQN